MFDWNDQELADIVWGEASESGDHIVPYPNESDQSKKQRSQENRTANPLEKKTSGTKNDVPSCKLESSHCDKNEGLRAQGFDMDPWTDLSLPISACNKGYTGRDLPDSIDTDISHDLNEIPNFGPARGTSQLDDNPELFGDEQEDKERGDFLDYSWENIGSFDDLDKIFRNEGPIFGHESLGNADEPWSPSSKVITSLGLRELGDTSEQYEVKMDFFLQENNLVTTGYRRANNPLSHNLQNECPKKVEVGENGCFSSIDPEVNCFGRKNDVSVNAKEPSMIIENTVTSNSLAASESSATKNNFVDKASRQRTSFKSQIKTEENGKAKISEELCGTRSPSENQFKKNGNQFATSAVQIFPSSILNTQGHLIGPESFTYLHASHPHMPAGYVNLTHDFPAMPLLSPVHSERDRHQSMLFGYELSSGSSKREDILEKSPDVQGKSLAMTPQEKIEKLRRRQQMQAMLAIQKQQQQFSHQVIDHSVTQKHPKENQIQHAAENNFENPKVLPSLDPSSPVEQDDSNTISMVGGECPLEETILDQLQDVIEKLDIKIRLCIQNSLFRLAQSAMQRHDASDTTSTNKSSRNENEIIGKEENGQDRLTRMADMETETNPIDRVVAYFLFHNPLKSSTKSVEDGEIPEWPIEPKREGFMNLPMRGLSENSTDKQSGSFIKTPENASNMEQDGSYGG